MTKRANLEEQCRQLRRKVAQLEAETRSEPDLEATQLALRERMKELECLYTLSRLRDRHAGSPEGFLQELAAYLPASFLMPENACARISWEEKSFVSAEFSEGPYRIAATFQIDGNVAGQVELFYPTLSSLSSEEPFLPEEYKLIDGVAGQVGRTLEHMKRDEELKAAHKALRCEHQALQETNVALRTVMNRLEQEKQEIRAMISGNIRKIILPIVYELELQVSEENRAYVSVLRQNLGQIAAPLLSQIGRNHVELSPAEIIVCTMIRNGLSTKEIARVRGISSSTVRRHRENIRRKLGLQNRKVNLTTYLQSAGQDPLTRPHQPNDR